MFVTTFFVVQISVGSGMGISCLTRVSSPPQETDYRCTLFLYLVATIRSSAGKQKERQEESASRWQDMYTHKQYCNAQAERTPQTQNSWELNGDAVDLVSVVSECSICLDIHLNQWQYYVSINYLCTYMYLLFFY